MNKLPALLEYVAFRNSLCSGSTSHVAQIFHRPGADALFPVGDINTKSSGRKYSTQALYM